MKRDDFIGWLFTGMFIALLVFLIWLLVTVDTPNRKQCDTAWDHATTTADSVYALALCSKLGMRVR